MLASHSYLSRFLFIASNLYKDFIRVKKLQNPIVIKIFIEWLTSKEVYLATKIVLTMSHDH